MYVLVSRVSGVIATNVVDCDNFRQLHVQLVDVDNDGLAAALAAKDLGEIDVGTDGVWLNIGALRAAGRPSDQWREGFDAMLRYAQTKGWTDPSCTRIRAHLERGDRLVGRDQVDRDPEQ